MPHTITIAGKPFTVEPKFEAGHVLTANEASTLNQTWFENLRNNFAPKAKEGGSQDQEGMIHWWYDASKKGA